MPDAIELEPHEPTHRVARQMRLLSVQLEHLTRNLCSVAIDLASFATNLRAVADDLEFSPAATTRPSEGAVHRSPGPPGPRPDDGSSSHPGGARPS